MPKFVSLDQNIPPQPHDLSVRLAAADQGLMWPGGAKPLRQPKYTPTFPKR